jgi:hypothetical protein
MIKSKNVGSRFWRRDGVFLRKCRIFGFFAELKTQKNPRRICADWRNSENIRKLLKNRRFPGIFSKNVRVFRRRDRFFLRTRHIFGFFAGPTTQKNSRRFCADLRIFANFRKLLKNCGFPRNFSKNMAFLRASCGRAVPIIQEYCII